MPYFLWLWLMFGPKHYYQPPVYIPPAPIVQQFDQQAGPGVVDTRCRVTIIGKTTTLTVCP